MDELDPSSHTKSFLNMFFHPKQLLKLLFGKIYFLPSPPIFNLFYFFVCHYKIEIDRGKEKMKAGSEKRR